MSHKVVPFGPQWENWIKNREKSGNPDLIFKMALQMEGDGGVQVKLKKSLPTQYNNQGRLGDGNQTIFYERPKWKISMKYIT